MYICVQDIKLSTLNVLACLITKDNYDDNDTGRIHDRQSMIVQAFWHLSQANQRLPI